MILALITILAFEAGPASDEARALFEEARREYQDEHYAQALVGFERAWHKKQIPELLFNIGQCHFQLGDYPAAIEHYQRYLALQPAAKNRPLVEEVIAEARLALATHPPSLFNSGAASLATERTDDTSMPAESHPPDPLAKSNEHDDGSGWLWAGAIAGTVAVVAVAGAVAFVLAGQGTTAGVPDTTRAQR